jgi:CO/xanthine dehydrogenase Mo-binding subunit
MSQSVIGQPPARVDGPAKVTVAARYAAEFDQPNQVHAVIVGSTVGLGKVAKVHAAPVLRLPGVIAGWIWKGSWRNGRLTPTGRKRFGTRLKNPTYTQVEGRRELFERRPQERQPNSRRPQRET